MNSCAFVGRVVNVPVVRTVGNGNVAEFTLALNRTFKKNGVKTEVTSYLDMKVWGEQANIAEKFLTKGKLISVVASAEQEKWVDKTDGGNRSKITFRVDRFEFINTGGKKEDDSQEVSSNQADIDDDESEEKSPF